MKKKVILIDRHPLIYVGLEKILKEHGYQLINGYSKGEDIYTVILQNQPSFIIIDITQPLICAAEFLRVASTLNIKAKIIVFSEYENVHNQRECLASGINAYIPKRLDSREIINAMANKEISGQLHLSNKTVSTHKKSLFKKLCTDSLVQAVDIARLHALP
jgi:DNA-binding NarL/FixJ family response regulator